MQRIIWQSFGADGAGRVSMRVGLSLFVIALVATSLALSLTGPEAILPLLPAILVVTLTLLAAYRKSEANAARLTKIAKRLDSSLESLKDLQWEVSEREARYRDLLDHQGDVIVRRDSRGRLTFVNDAFCRTFGMKRAAALGTVFHPPALNGEQLHELAPKLEGRTSRMVELSTANGPRWFVWEDFALPREGNGPGEIQSVGRDVTEQRAAELALAQARDEAMTASQAKSRFLASMSHEIRTPMNGILGMTGLLLDTTLSPEQRTYARAISTSATTLLSLIDEVLDFSKIEAGKVDLLEAPFNIADATQSVIELLAPRARDKGLEIGWFAAPDLPATVIGDEMRVRQILMNLVGNAIKFTERGGVALTLQLVPAATDNGRATIRLAVRDTGPGVPPHALERIFSEFEQAEQGPARRHGGTGLGLAITKRLVDAMGGRIDVASEPRAGSTFAVELALATPYQDDRIGDNWPKPRQGERILVVLDGIVEPAIIYDLLDAMGASATHVGAADAERIAADAATEDMPFSRLLTDKANMTAGAERAVPYLGAKDGTPRALVILDQTERNLIPELRSRGFSGYLIRPVRPVSALTQLFCETAPVSTPLPRWTPRLQLAAPPAHCANATEQLSVLLAEDNEINALLATTVLERSGARVVRAHNGNEAIATVREALAKTKTFDLVLMDIQMPDMDGVAAAEGIRALYPKGARAGTERPPIVALTANAYPEDQAAYFAAGLDGYLAKPFEAQDLAALLVRLDGGMTKTRREHGVGAG